MNQPRISLIAAIATEDRGIGLANALLWRIPEDFLYFKEKTSGHAIILGENTFHSIGRPLPYRTNIILSVDPDFTPPGCTVVRDIDEALAQARNIETEEVFVCGGVSVYRQFLPLADRLYLTLVEGKYEADTFFPEYSQFKREISRIDMNNGTYRFSFVIMER